MSRTGSDLLPGTLYMCALGAKRTNKVLVGFASCMTAAGKPPKVILVAVASKLPVSADAVIRTQKPFSSSSHARSNAD